MPSRIVFRRGIRGGRVTQFYRNRSVVPGGQTKPVRPGSSRNAPIYAYQRPQVSARKLVHFWPLVSSSTILKVNTSSVQVPSANANWLLLNGIGQGDGLDARHANKVWMRDLQLGFTYLTPTVTCSYNVIVVYDRESRGVSPSIADIFDVSTDPLSQQRVVNRERFDIIFRKEMVAAPEYFWNGTSTISYPTASMVADYSFRIPINRMAFYSGTTTSMGDILKGGLFVFIWGDFSVGPSNPEVQVCPRLEFVDFE